ncbi:hypothetical protein C8J57DRAFT_1718318 [Mycena rebaudengoi]|nr:hypothetical protein C8J57DRAFT_1718318 [Mycena rebaudengoi]
MPSPRLIVRLAILATVSLFALISMGLAAALIAAASQAGPFLGITSAAPALAIVVAILTLLTAPLMIALEIVRPGAYFTSMIIFEILWLGFLSVMWLASGAAQAVENIILTGACTFASSDNFFDGFSDDPRSPDNSFQNICGEARAIAAFSFLNWLILMFYTLTVMIMSCVAMSRKRGRVWTESFANAPLSASASAEKGPIPGTYQPSYPHVQQVQQHTGGSVQTGALHDQV